MINTDICAYIRARVEMLGSALGRRTNPEMVRIFQRHLARFTMPVLQKAFEKAESELERFPTPRKMLEIAASLQASPLWKYSYHDVKTVDPETGSMVNAKRDPNTGETLYRATDCPEGRSFLETLKSRARKTSRSQTAKAASEGPKRPTERSTTSLWSPVSRSDLKTSSKGRELDRRSRVAVLS